VHGPTGTSAESSASAFTYTVGVPTITSMSPSCGPISGGTSVVITGNYFTGLSGATAVKFGDLNAADYTVDSATQITAVSPAHALGAVRLVTRLARRRIRRMTISSTCRLRTTGGSSRPHHKQL
jgi:hypothetical protein